ncbi:LppP/LprE family lipoprotein [Nocardia sp. NPDC048505]|uniref:LppP/LprE family lipoprotein n=1 Tax=unclassified Nocardia TaxID=2637762 RepID=UPI003407FAF4
MRITSVLAVLAASAALAVTGCGSDSSEPDATPTTPRPPVTASRSDAETPPLLTAPPSPATAPPTQAPATSPADPPGGGHGLCFDLNSELAHAGFAKVAAAEPSTTWTIPGASEDAAEAGCAGVLSWMTMEGIGIHPVTHVLFFADGKYLGTASAEPYAYTQVIGKTRSTVSVQYKWPLPEDALCCPTGGPSVVTFTLVGATLQATGQFPPAG